MKKITVAIGLVFAAIGLSAAVPLRNGAIWYDTNGYPINAHGGSVVYVKGQYWWYGEHKVYGKAGNKSHVGIHVYSSENLVDWRDEGVAFANVEDPTVPETDGCVFEMAKVIYRPEVGQLIMFSHLEPKGHGYNDGLTLISRANRPNEPFRRMRILNPSGRISRDMNVFTDDDGRHYHVYASTWNNRTMYIDELTEDCKDYTGVSYEVLKDEMCEAPMILKANGWYFLVCSKCTGWKPNTARLYRSRRLAGPWEYVGNPCTGGENPYKKMGPDKTWGAQSCSFIKIEGKKDTYVAMFDVWNPDNQLDSRYLFLPVVLKGDTLEIPWRDTFAGVVGSVPVLPLKTESSEVVKFFASNVYGERPDLTNFKKTCSVADCGIDPVLKAHRREITLNTMTPWGVTNFTALALEPEHAAGTRVPCFVYVSFQRPSEMLAHPDDPAQRAWRWPVKDILARGYATVAFYYEDVFPDDPPGVRDWGRSTARPANGWGAISTWALAASRVMDYLETADGIDAAKVAIAGHSRLGKTALWTGATDKRFAYTIINDSGCMGARMSTRTLPGAETIEIITRSFPHWFAPNLRQQFAGKEGALPFDQHWLVASLAPRLVTVGSAEDDNWACPSGEHASLDAARPAWGDRRDRCHYHFRSGGHDITPADWADYMDFAEKHGWKDSRR